MAEVFFDPDVGECNSLSLIANEPEIISGKRLWPAEGKNFLREGGTCIRVKSSGHPAQAAGFGTNQKMERTLV